MNILSLRFILLLENRPIRTLYISVITKSPNTEQSSKGKGKTHMSKNRKYQSTTGKVGKPQWP